MLIRQHVLVNSIIYVFLSLEVIGKDRKCSKQSDCVDLNADPCAICAENNDGHNGQCIDIYPNEYLPSPSCDKINGEACSLKCGNGKCHTEYSSHYFSPFCECISGYGKTCQYDNPDNLAVLNYVRMIFNGMVRACQFTDLQYQFQSSAPGIVKRSIIAYVKVGTASFRIFPVTLKLSSTTNQYDVVLIITAVFPHKSKGNIFKLDDTLIGYKTNVQMRVYYDRKLGFEETWDVFVKYDGLKCFPRISTTNCGTTNQVPAVFLRSDQIHIKIDVDYIADGTRISSSMKDEKCNTNEHMVRKIWKINKGMAVSPLPIYENYKRSSSISFNHYEMEIGEYELEITVTNVELDDSPSNDAYCYFKVKCIPLVARVEGGIDRMVSPNIALLLRADSSYDPNMPSYNQGHLNIEWSCVNILFPDRKESMCEAKKMLIHEHFYAPPKSLTPGAIYNFTVKVWTDLYNLNTDCDHNVSPKFVHFRVEVATLNVSQLGNVVIECLDNCGVKMVPSNELLLKAVQPFLKYGSNRDAYEWTFYENEDKEEFVDKIIVTGVRSLLLIVKENSFKYNTKYTIVARVKNSPWYAKYSLETYNIDFDANCSLTPENGIKGLTQFDINCTVDVNLSKDSLTFEYYDKTAEEKNEGAIFSGRMLGTSKDGILKDVRLTRGFVLIYILNQYGLKLVKYVEIVLKDWAIDDTVLREIYQNVTNELRFGSVQSTIGSLSFIPDIVPDEMEKNKSDILNTLLNFVTQVSSNDFGDIKLCISTLTIILLTMNQPNQLQLKPYYIEAAFKTIHDQVHIFSQNILSGEVQNMSPKEGKIVIISILNCLEAGLLSRDTETENIQEDFLEFSVLHQLQKASLHIEAVIALISKTLSYVQVKGQPATRLSSKGGTFIIWVMVSDDSYSIPELLSADDEIPIRFSIDLYNSMIKSVKDNENIAVQVVSMKDNIFWWSLSDVRSKLVSVSLCRKYKKKHFLPIRYVDKPMTIIMDMKYGLNATTITGTALSSDYNSDSFYLDNRINIHRFDLAPRSLMTITFRFPPTNGSLRVYVTDQFRPDYAILDRKGINVTEGSPIYHVPYYLHDDEPYFVYMGIIAGLEVPENQNVVYGFEINTTVCKVWASGQWSSAGCVIRKVESGRRVNCECTHFSIFAAAFPVPPNSIDPFGDAKLFLTVTQNPLVVGFVVMILLTYLLLCLFFWWSDKQFKKNRIVIVLEDNLPDDQWPYLIAVFTSFRMNSGTSAHVGVKIIGSHGTSRSHVFTCKTRTVLQRSNDDWFLIYSPEHLGEVEGLQIWHDNTGSSPEWLCNKIIVYDLLQNTETLFIVGEWLALNGNEYPESYVLSAAVEDIFSMKSLFTNNVILGLREHHVLLSCAVCHPRSILTRMQRLSICMCSVMVAMLCGIMFYLPEDEKLDIDSYDYSFTDREIFVGLQTMIISVSASTTVFFLFQKSYKTSHFKHHASVRVRELPSNKKSVIYTFDNKHRGPSGGPLYNNFVRMVSKTVKPNSLCPVQLPNKKPLVEVHRFWLILSWSVCTTIICVSSYLVMLYGLKLGLVHSKEWLSSLLIATGGEIVLFAPIRIVFMSSLLAVALLQMFDLSIHQVSVEDLNLVRKPDDVQHINKVIHIRSQTMYRPLDKKQRYQILRRRDLKQKWYTFVDIIIAILTIAVLHNVMFQLWILHFYSNYHAVKIMTLPNKYALETIHFFGINNISGFEKYLHYTFANCLHNLRWYNSRLLNSDMDTITSKYWTSDYTHRTIGLPVIRQLRVVPKRCDSLVLNRGYCIPRWSSRTEDKDDYGEMWKPATWREATRVNSPWRYSEMSGNLLIDHYRLFGQSGVSYDSGGYLEELGPTRTDTELKLAELIENAWLDGKTRVVFVEFSLYNVNEDVFTKVSLMIESFISGNTLPQARAMSVRTKKYISVWNILFVALIVYYLLTCSRLLCRHGIAEFISKFNNLCRLLIVLLGFTSIILYFIHYRISAEYSESLQRNELDDYTFTFDILALSFVLLRHVLTLLLCIVIIHGMSLIKLRKYVMGVFVISLSWIFWITIHVAIILVALMLIRNLFDYTGHFNLKTIIIKERSLQNLLPEELQYFHIKLFAFTKIVTITICTWCFVNYFVMGSKLANVRRYKKV